MSLTKVNVEADAMVTIHTSQIRKAIRNAKTEALEGAAKICERQMAYDCAARIRALKEDKP